MEAEHHTLHDPEYLTGNLEQPSYEPGDVLPVRISSSSDGVMQLVRLRHGDTNPAGPGLLQEPIHEAPTVTFAAGLQTLRSGSFGRLVLDRPVVAEGTTVTAWVWPTTEEGTIVSFGIHDSAVAISVSAGHVRVGIGDAVHGSRVRLRPRRWQLLSVGLAGAWIDVRVWDDGLVDEETMASGGQSLPEIETIVVAARDVGDHLEGLFDGKIEAVTVWPGVHDGHASASVVADTLAQQPLLALHFGGDLRSVVFTERVSGATGVLHNMPSRGVTAHAWKGQVESWRDRPDLYAAVHFHSDDLADAEWHVTTEYRLPDSIPSGMYALHMENGEAEDWLTFVVRRAPGATPNPLLVLIPSLTYLAYANEPIFHPHVPSSRDARDDWAERHGLLSQYNWHADGSGVAFASWRRPMTNLRPDYRYWLTGHPHGPGADLYLLHWLESIGLGFDLITDHDLDRLGTDAVADHQVLVTGCHPEYWTVVMLETLDSFERGGGRVAYLGGNGLAALVAVHHEQPWVSEMRRRGGSAGLWDADPGETYFASDGRIGGSTRLQYLRGRELIGVDITGMGFSDGQPYRRTTAADDARVAFAFDGIDASIIGDFGLHMGGAAGYEVDSADVRTGTPPHALVVASCDTVPPHYVKTEQRGDARADMVFFETPAGGAVFSVSSITWTGSLSHRGGDNEVARITENVLRRFLDPTPFVYSRELQGSGS